MPQRKLGHFCWVGYKVRRPAQQSLDLLEKNYSSLESSPSVKYFNISTPVFPIDLAASIDF